MTIAKLRNLVSGCRIIGAVLVVSSAATLPAMADDGAPAISYPYLKGEITIEVQSDHTYKADDPANELSDTYNTTEAELGFHFTPNVSIQAGLVFEPVRDATKDRVFEDHGLYIEQLYGLYELNSFKLFGGKFNVNFGKAWDVTPGVYGADFAEDGYEFTERIGFGAGVTRDAGGLGEVTVTAALFRADTSGLSNSAITSRGQLSVDDGGIGNTETLQNFAIAIDGEKIPSLPGISYHLAYIHQGKGRDVGVPGFGELDDQNGYVFGLIGEKQHNSVKFAWNLEAAYFDNYILDDEIALSSIWFLTAGAKVSIDKFNLAAAYTYRPADIVGGGEFEDHQLALSAGYEIKEGLTFDVGYKYHVEQDEDNHTIGVLLTKKLEFNTGKPVESLK